MKTLENVILESSVRELEIAVGVITYNLSSKFQDDRFSEFVKVLSPIAKRIIRHRNILVVDKLKIYEDMPLGLVHTVVGLNFNKDEILKFKSTTLGVLIHKIIDEVLND
jgi:hypothetical protein